jgi:hypothetical protein
VPVDRAFVIARVSDMDVESSVLRLLGNNLNSQRNLLEFPSLRSLMSARNDFNKGRSVASEAAVIPNPGSMADQMASNSMSLYQLKLGLLNAGTQYRRAQDAMQPLYTVSD